MGDPENAKRYGMRSGREKYFNNLIKLFPEEEAAIKKYEKLIEVGICQMLLKTDHDLPTIMFNNNSNDFFFL